MTKSKGYLLALILVAYTCTANAIWPFKDPIDHGRWLCDSDCGLGKPPSVQYDPGGVDAFIYSVKNLEDKSKPWGPNDLVTVCDGAQCMTFVFKSPPGQWLPKGPTFKDNGKGYKNSNVTLSSGWAGGDPFSTYRVTYTFATPVDFRTVTVTVGPEIEQTVLPTGGRLGGDRSFSMGFEWGSALSSDAAVWSPQGGQCSRSTGLCMRQY